MSSRMPRATAAPPPGPADETKQCCARFYESDLVGALLGDSFHPGGLALTERLGSLLELGPARHVVDAASGTGASALFLARRFGCRVTGVELGLRNVERARAEAARLGLDGLVRFECGDVERLPLADASADAVICECAFCTFPDKHAAAGEFARVLGRGGRLGLTDVTREEGTDGELGDLMSWIACLADARPSDAYAEWLVAAGFEVTVVEAHAESLREMVRAVGRRLFAAETLAALQALDLKGVDFDAARRLVRQASGAVGDGRIGYTLICAARP
jgi:arsenite methyltransferase